MIVVFTDQAVADLEAIGDYLAQFDLARARSFVSELVAKAHGLAEMSQRFPLVSRYAHLGIRRRVYRNYLIFYRAEEARVVVVHVLHGARDYEPLLFREP